MKISLNLTEFKKSSVNKLTDAGFEKTEALAEINILMEEIFQLTCKDILTNNEYFAEDYLLQRFNKALSTRIIDRIPMQYLINKAYFMSESFYVDQNVLIPRPETELLVEKTLEIAHTFDDKQLKIIDIGTGSGCIACMVAKLLNNTNIIASDISSKALEIAKFNADKLSVSHKISFINSDILQNINDKADIIVSNPPYIPLSDKDNLQDEVKNHEPQAALFTKDPEGMEYYIKIIKQSRYKLNMGGYILLESGINQASNISQLLNNAGFIDIRIYNDLNSIERVIIAQYSQ